MNVILPPDSIHTWQSPFELEWLLAMFKQRDPKHILELGSADGGTIWCWAHNCSPGAHILSVDWFMTEHYPDNRHLYGRWAEKNTCKIDWIKGDTRSDDTLARVRDFAPFDWIFIDAGHGIKEVTSDWERYSPMAAKGSVVVFHDITPTIAPGEIEVHLLWKELRKLHPHIEIFENESTNKLGLGLLFL